MGKVDIYKDGDKWYWAYFSSNGKCLAKSAKGYKERRSLVYNLEAVKKDIELAEVTGI